MEVAILIILFILSGMIKSANERKQRRIEQEYEEEPVDPAAPAGAGPADLLEEIRKAVEQMKQQQSGRDVRRQLPLPSQRPRWQADDDDLDEAKLEERESLEIEPRIVSLETLPVRAERSLIDKDEEAEAIAAARRRWAERYARPLTAADHREFDRRIRSKEAEQPEAASEGWASPERLRQLFVWHEILGKPVSLRDR